MVTTDFILPILLHFIGGLVAGMIAGTIYFYFFLFCLNFYSKRRKE